MRTKERNSALCRAFKTFSKLWFITLMIFVTTFNFLLLLSAVVFVVFDVFEQYLIFLLQYRIFWKQIRKPKDLFYWQNCARKTFDFTFTLKIVLCILCAENKCICVLNSFFNANTGNVLTPKYDKTFRGML